MFTPELWILFSFLCFIAFFGKKLYKTVVEQLDAYIKGVEQKIQEAEDLKNEALDALKEANKKKEEIEELIKAQHRASEEKITKLTAANEKYINHLTDSFRASFEKKVQADLSKRINEVKTSISDMVLRQLEKEILSKKPKIRVSKTDLERLK